MDERRGDERHADEERGRVDCGDGEGERKRLSRPPLEGLTQYVKLSLPDPSLARPDSKSEGDGASQLDSASTPTLTKLDYVWDAKQIVSKSVLPPLFTSC